jgi:hypothetical protein
MALLRSVLSTRLRAKAWAAVMADLAKWGMSFLSGNEKHLLSFLAQLV